VKHLKSSLKEIKSWVLLLVLNKVAKCWVPSSPLANTKRALGIWRISLPKREFHSLFSIDLGFHFKKKNDLGFEIVGFNWLLNCGLDFLFVMFCWMITGILDFCLRLENLPCFGQF
jgi:hypothetical protein